MVFQVMINGRYKSTEHRALKNSCRAMLSIGVFYAPGFDAEIGPHWKSLISFWTRAGQASNRWKSLTSFERELDWRQGEETRLEGKTMLLWAYQTWQTCMVAYRYTSTCCCMLLTGIHMLHATRTRMMNTWQTCNNDLQVSTWEMRSIMRLAFYACKLMLHWI